MISGAIAAFFILIAAISFSGGSAGAGAVGIVIALLVLAMGSAAREDAKAQNNFVRYWAEGGPDRDRRRRRR